MTKLVVSICCVQFLVLVAALATPGDDLLVAKLPKELRAAAKIPQAPLVQAVTEAVKESRPMAPQITRAAVQRAIDCAAAEAVLRAALRQLAPSPSEVEVLVITRAAIRAAPRSEETTVNRNGHEVASDNCTETLLVAAASEYPSLAEILNDGGKQVAEKQLGEKEAIPQPTENGPYIIPPAVVLPPNEVGLVSTTTPITAGGR
jgi:hypothetical protein